MKKSIMAICAAALICSAFSLNTFRVNGKELSMLSGETGAYAEGSTGFDFNKLVASKVYVDRKIDVARFDEIVSKGNFNIIYTVGDPAVTVHASDNVVDHIIVSVKDACLEIRSDGTRFLSIGDVEVYVSSRSLNTVKINGSGDFEAEHGMCGENVSLNINGAGDIDIDGLLAENVEVTVNGAGDIDIDKLECKELSVTINGAGDADISGKSESADLKINGAGGIDIKELVCPKVYSSVKGIGEISRNR